MRNLGYLEKLHHDRLPNFKRYAAPVLQDPQFDPGNRYHLPWQGGITGIGFNPALTGRDITSVNDLWDPKFKGHVAITQQMPEAMGLVLLGLGIEPSTATVADAEKAAKVLTDARESGQVREFDTATEGLARGDIAVGTIVTGHFLQIQQDHPDLQFVIPKEGAILWTDCSAIPVRAEHPTDAHIWLDYVFKPEVAAQITEVVQTICPVPEAQQVMKDAAETVDDPKRAALLRRLSSSELVFPTEEVYSNVHRYNMLGDPDEARAWYDLFQDAIGG
jgi:spermidine/putrescine transport system substrate-binding protein